MVRTFPVHFSFPNYLYLHPFPFHNLPSDPIHSFMGCLLLFQKKVVQTVVLINLPIHASEYGSLTELNDKPDHRMVFDGSLEWTRILLVFRRSRGKYCKRPHYELFSTKFFSPTTADVIIIKLVSRKSCQIDLTEISMLRYIEMETLFNEFYIFFSDIMASDLRISM